jgi:hypothetical protein
VFDSRRELQRLLGIIKLWKRLIRWLPIKFQPAHDFQYVYRNGKRLGPFVYSTAWTHVENLEKQIFDDYAENEREVLKKSAYNKRYVPPENPVHLAREVRLYYKHEASRWKEEAIAAKKELSDLKREKDDGLVKQLAVIDTKIDRLTNEHRRNVARQRRKRK